MPVHDTTAATVTNAFISMWVAWFRCSAIIVTDGGCQFESLLFKKLLKLLGAAWLWTAPYYPQTNRLVEFFYRHLKAALTAHISLAKWLDALPLTLLGILSAFKEDRSSTSAELAVGAPVHLSADFLDANKPNSSPMPSEYVENLYDVSANSNPVWASHSRTVYMTPDLHKALHVLARYGPVCNIAQHRHSLMICWL